LHLSKHLSTKYLAYLTLAKICTFPLILLDLSV
jgi:hypothetical protein